MNAYQIHVDTGILSTQVYKQNNNPFDCTYVFTQPHRRVRSAILRNIQIPIGWFNIRSPYNTIVINGTTYTLTPGYYATINDVVTALNTLVTAGVGVFSVSSNRVVFTSAAASATITIPNSLYPTVSTYTTTGSNTVNQSTTVIPTTGYSTFPSLTSILGFTNGQSGKPIIATNLYNLSYDLYCHVYIQNLAPSSQEAIQSTFKIPLTATFGGIQSIDYSNNRQIVTVTDSSCIIDRLIIKIVDRWGNTLNNNGIDWSMTIEMCSDS
jgi:hypothetical protein